jgi:hypothetical protein
MFIPNRKRAAIRCRGLILIQASAAARCSGRVAVRKIHPPRRRPVMRFYTQQHKLYCGIDHAGAEPLLLAFHLA